MYFDMAQAAIGYTICLAAPIILGLAASISFVRHFRVRSYIALTYGCMMWVTSAMGVGFINVFLLIATEKSFPGVVAIIMADAAMVLLWMTFLWYMPEDNPSRNTRDVDPESVGLASRV